MFRLLGGIFMGWSLGANDAANTFGPGVTSKVIKFSTAVILIAIFVIIGATLDGPKCMNTMKGLGKFSALSNVSNNQTSLLNIAFFCTLSAAITITLMTVLAIPSSTSQAIMGAIVGAMIGLTHRIPDKPTLIKLGKIVVCWIFTPIGAAIISFILFKLCQIIVNNYIRSDRALSRFITIGLLFSGCYGAYSLGANNVANVTGIFYAVDFFKNFSIKFFNGNSIIFSISIEAARAAAIVGGLSIALGALTYSKNVMLTVGSKITMIGPLAAFIAILAEAITLHLFTFVGVPVSSSQAIVGSVVGIGLIRGIKAVSKGMLINIVTGWITTPLLAGILTAIAVKFI